MTPYKILGIDERATDEEVKRAYHRMAAKYHPDAGGDAWAFEQVRSAYDAIKASRNGTVTDGSKAEGPASQTASPRRSNPAKPTREKSSERTPPQSNQAHTNQSAPHHSKPNRPKTDPASPQDSKASRPKYSTGEPLKNAYTNPTESRTNSYQSAPTAKTEPSSISSDGLSWTSVQNVVMKAIKHPLPLQSETCTFILINVLDIVMTNILLRSHAIESNPLANFFLHHGGFRGLIAFKMVIVAVVCVIAQVVAIKNPTRAKQLLYIGSAIVAVVVIYSATLIIR